MSEIWEFYAWDIGDPSVWYWRSLNSGCVCPGTTDGPDMQA